jgi:ABC-type Na+ efflux pump permease subunit
MRWRKVAVVASTEFNNAVRTRAFIASVVMLPLIYGLAFFIQAFASKADTRTRAFALIDDTGALTPAIEAAVKLRNETEIFDDGGKQIAPKFEMTVVEPESGTASSGQMLQLSDKVRSGELFGFFEIPADILDPAKSSLELKDKAVKLRYFTNTPTDFELSRWFERTVNQAIQQARFKSQGLDPLKVAQAMMPVSSDTLGLVDRLAAESGAGPTKSAELASEAKKVDPIRTFGPPIALVFVMFITIMSTTPQLMQTVLEEKMSKISEVLLGSLSPFELMLGKLLGNVGVALLLATLYLGTAYGVALRYGMGDMAPPWLVLATVLFIFLGVTLFGSLFMAIGSACNDLKDAQSLMFPVMMLAMMPAFFWSVVLFKPSSPLAVGISLFPPATPFLMLMRMSLSPAPPAWQVGLSVVLTSLAALGCVWAAAKIFRTGLLMQGKAPNFAELARWVVAK